MSNTLIQRSTQNQKNLKAIQTGIQLGVNAARRGLATQLNAGVTPALPRANVEFIINGAAPVPRQPVFGGTNTTFGHAKNPQQPSAGSAPSNTPAPGK